jgi:hypothetical protein
MATFRFLVLVGVVGMAGCIPEREAPTAIAAQTDASWRGCGDYGCGDNSPNVAGEPFWGLWLNGTENEAHVRYLHFARNLALMKIDAYTPLDVDGGRLRVWFGGAWQYGPSALENGILQIAIGRAKYYIKIAHVHSGTVGGTDLGEPFWTRITAPRAETYELQWTSIDGPVDADGEPRFEEVCKQTTLDDHQWHNQIDAVIFEGEKYDLDTKEIELTPTAGSSAWFNIACEGSLPAKMYLTMRTTASNVVPGYVSTIDNDRQAMVHAWAAEYCGRGISFTQTGHKLLMQDHMPIFDGLGWLPREAPIGFTQDELEDKLVTVEAVWDGNGAVCLETPRLAVDDPKVPPDPDIEKHILDLCGSRPLPCSQYSWFPTKWFEHGKLVTATTP